MGTGIASGGAINLPNGFVQAVGGNVTLGADVIDLGTPKSVSGTGYLLYTPIRSDRPMQIGGTDTNTQLVFTEADRLAVVDGFRFLEFGSSTSVGNITTGGDLTPFTSELGIVCNPDPVQGNITITNKIDATNNPLKIFAARTLSIEAGGELLTSGGIYIVSTYPLADTAALTIDVDGGIINGEGGNISINNSDWSVGPNVIAGPAFVKVENKGEVITSGTGGIQYSDTAPAGPGNVGLLITSGGRVTAGGGDSTKSLALNYASHLFLTLESDKSAAAGYQFVHVDGPVDLGYAFLELQCSGPQVPGTTFAILDNHGSGPITNTFQEGLDGAYLTSAAEPVGTSFQLSYKGADDSPIVLTTVQAPIITLQPQNQIVETGNSVTFTATATGSPPPTVQWQQENPGGTFSDIPGATSTTLTFVPRIDQNGLHYRAVFTSNGVPTTTNEAQLTVQNIFETLSNSSVTEFRPAGTIVGTLTASEFGSGHMFTYSYPSDNSAPFTVVGDKLVTTDVLQTSVTNNPTILVKVTDESGYFQIASFTILIVKDPNLSLSGQILTVNGTSGNDVFSFAASAVEDVMSLNGVKLAADISLVKTVVFQGGAGNDTAYLSGLVGSKNTLTLTPLSGTMAGTGYTVVANNVETTQAFGNKGDVAYLYDNSGQNTYAASPSYSFFTGAGFYENEVGFSTANAFAAKGTSDSAYLYDAGGNNVFVGTPTYSYLTNNGYFKQAVGFKSVNAFATSTGYDSAYLFDSGGTNTFVGNATNSYLSGSGYFNQVTGFAAVQARSGTGANDTAYLFGGANNNVFTANSSYSYMYGLGYLNEAVGFKAVSAIGSASDTATLYDAAGVNTFTGQGPTGQLAAADVTYSAAGFGYVNIVQSLGSYDTALTDAITFALKKVGVWH